MNTRRGNTSSSSTRTVTVPSASSRVHNKASCNHDEVYRDMCVLCGTDLRHLEANRRDEALSSATVSMIHSVPELKVSREKAEQLGKVDEQHLLNDRKLVLLVDLDQTIIHTTNANVSPDLKGVHHFQLYGPSSPWYHTKVRPHVDKFLANVSKKYELHICTFGVHVYAHTIARILDPSQRLFGHRILSRDELLDPHSKTGNLSALFPCGDELVCIIDDREDVWNFSTNCIAVKPYLYFKNTGDINWPPQNQSQPSTATSSSSTTAEPSTSCCISSSTASSSSEGKEKIESTASGESSSKATSSQEKTSTSDPSTSSTFSSSCTLDDASAPPKSEEESETKTTATTESTSTSSETLAATSAATCTASPSTESSSTDKREEYARQEEPSTSNLPSTTSTSPSTSTGQEEVNDEVEEDTDDYLLYLEDILDRIHKKFYELYDEKLKYKSENEQIRLPDLKDVIPQVRSTTLAGCNIVFSGVIPTNTPIERSREYLVARSLGATIGRSVIVDGSPLENTTHVVAAKMGTAKVNAALKASKKRKVYIVNPLWLSSCAERWERVSEQLFALKQTDDFQGKSQLHHRQLPQVKLPGFTPSPSSSSSLASSSSSLPCTSSSSSSSASSSSCTSSGSCERSNKLVDSMPPLAVFSADDLLTMDQEVEEACSTDDEDDENVGDTENKVLRPPPEREEYEDDDDEREEEEEDEDEREKRKNTTRRLFGETLHCNRFSESEDDDDDDDEEGEKIRDYETESSTSSTTSSSNGCLDDEGRQKRKRKRKRSHESDSPTSSLDENMAGDLVEQEFLRESM